MVHWNLWLVFAAVFAAEVSAKLAMVTIVWVGKPSHKGLGSIFLAKAKKNLNAVAYVISAADCFPSFRLLGNPLLGLVAVGVVLVSIPVAFVMNTVSNKVFGGVSGRHDWGNQRSRKSSYTDSVCGCVDGDGMKVPALIMAGGKGSRMGLPTEKPLLPFLGKPLIDWVAEAISKATKISEFYVITSSNTPKTEEHCISMGWKYVRTDAKGYHDDLKQAISKLGWMGPVLTMPSDVPAITGPVLDRIVAEFEVCGKDFLGGVCAD